MLNPKPKPVYSRYTVCLHRQKSGFTSERTAEFDSDHCNVYRPVVEKVFRSSPLKYRVKYNEKLQYILVLLNTQT